MRQQRGHIRQIARTSGSLQVATVDETAIDAAHIRIHNRHGLTKGEGRDGAGRVVANPR